jgi:O-antigen/teichoic acid export membrane protein
MQKKVLISGFFVFLFTFGLLFPNITTISESEQENLNFSFVYLESQAFPKMQERLGLDRKIQLDPQMSLPSSLSDYDGLILVDYVPSSEEINQMALFSQTGGGIFIIVGEQISVNATLLQVLNLTENTIGQPHGEITLPRVLNQDDPLGSKIEWNSVPTISNSTIFSLDTQINVIIEDSDQNALIFESATRNILTITIWPEEEHNAEFLQWPYYNYLLHLSEMKSIGESNFPDYPDWAYSPVPHIQDTIFLGFMVIIVTLITIGGFLYSQKYSRENKISEKDLEAMSTVIKTDQDWEDVGMHRQISGFLVQLFIGMLIIIPNAIMTSLVFPLIVLPSPQAAGFYDFTLRFFEALWLVFDLGTATVLVKYFAEHRVEKPQKAVRYIQIFIWYQMISGISQLFLVSFLGSIIFPRTFVAHMSWIFVTHAFFQWPAFFIVFILIFRAMNRIDLFQILNILLYGIFNITIQYLVIILFRSVLGPNIIFGDSLAGAIGYSVGNYVVRVATFLTGLWLFKRLGFSIKNLFRIDFNLEEIKESLLFGLKWAFGNMWVPLGWFLQVFLLASFLPNYTEQQGFFSLAWGFAGIVMLVGLFAESMLGGVSESFHASKKRLTQYYALSALKWGAFFDFFFVAVLIAIGPKFILGGAGEEWAGAAILIPWLLIFHALGFLSWIGDWMFAGSDRPGWAAGSWIIEQAIRAILLILLIPNHEFFSSVFNSPLVAVMFAYIPALICKNIYMWFGIRRSEYFRFKWEDLIWQGVLAPIIGAIITFGITSVMVTIIWQGEIITSVIILLLGTFPMIYIYSFIMGFLGAFDNNTLAEYKRAAYMAKGVGLLTRFMYWVTEKGVTLSPIHGKFAISIYDEAAAEAEILTDEKKRLII